MDAKEKLRNLYENYMLDRKYLGHGRRMRHLGGMEAILILMGIIPLGTPFEYKKKTISFKLLWIIPISFPWNENYEEFILRVAYETLTEKVVEVL